MKQWIITRDRGKKLVEEMIHDKLPNFYNYPCSVIEADDDLRVIRSWGYDAYPPTQESFVDSSWCTWKTGHEYLDLVADIARVLGDPDKGELNAGQSYLAEMFRRRIVLTKFVTELEQVTGPVVVFDTGYGRFGQFESGAEAAAAIMRSRIEWWALEEPPIWKRPEDWGQVQPSGDGC